MTSDVDLLHSAVPARAIGSRSEFQAAVRSVVSQLQAAGVRQLWWVSPDFAEWPLDEPQVVDDLTHWARLPGVQLNWLAHDFERVHRTMPRLVRWRQTFAHALNCRSPEELAGPDMPTLLMADRRLVLRLLDRERVRGWLSHEAADAQRAREEIDAISQRSAAAFPAVTLGL
jgi:hypothetical protein